MTFEELKKEAKRQGYDLVPRPKPQAKLLPCPRCGTSKRDYRYGLTIAMIPFINPGETWSTAKRKDYYVTCRKCGFVGPKAIAQPTQKKGKEAAIKGWNERVEKGDDFWSDYNHE